MSAPLDINPSTHRIAEPERIATPRPLNPDRLDRSLRLSTVHVDYGHVSALRGINLEVHQGEAVALLGRNGAGKSTLMRAVSRLVRLKSGSIHYEGTELTALAPHEVASVGIAHVPEGRRLFGTMTVLDNILLGSARGERRQLRAAAADLLDAFGIANRAHARAAELSGGQQQMVAIARGVIGDPTLLLLDEPSLGLSPLLVTQTTELLAKIRAERPHMSVLIAEQNAAIALELADRAYVLENGRVVHEARADGIDSNYLLDAYLGRRADQPT